VPDSSSSAARSSPRLDAAPLIARLAALASGPAHPVILIDGGSGSGKSTLAAALAAALSAAPSETQHAELVHLEDIYPGWDGLDAASRHVTEFVLASENPRWLDWNWTESRPGDWHDVDRTGALVIEGSGALSRANRELATFAIWVDLDADTRKRRAIARDGQTYAPHWDRWAAQENAFAERERPWELADVIIDAATGSER
jgi:uridine kinase